MGYLSTEKIRDRYELLRAETFIYILQRIWVKMVSGDIQLKGYSVRKLS